MYYLFKTLWSLPVHRHKLWAHLLLVIHLSGARSGEPGTSSHWWCQTLQPLVTSCDPRSHSPIWKGSRTRLLKQLRYGYCSVCLCTEPEKSSYVLLLHNLTTHWMVYSWGLFWPRELGVLNQRRSSQLCSGLRGKTKQADEQRWIKIPSHWESDHHQSPALLPPCDPQHFALATWSPDARFECNVSASLHVHMHAFTQKRRRCRR